MKSIEVPGVHVIKLFTSSLTVGHNKLKRFPQFVEYFRVRTEPSVILSNERLKRSKTI